MTWQFTLSGKEFVMGTCATCKTDHLFTKAIYDVAKAQAGKFVIFCPLGHEWVYKSQKSIDDEDLVRQERDRLKQRLAEKDDAILEQRNAREAAERKAAAAKGQVTRLKNRAKAGMCPCCNRHFTNLERHMSTKHADEKADA